MLHTALLQADGFVASFDLSGISDTNEYFNLVVGLQLDPGVGQVRIRSVPSKTHVDDVRDLVQYLLQHIRLLQENPDTHSPTFVPLELAFQLDALAGEVRSPDDGEFTIRIMLNVGADHREGTSIYVGGEAVVTLENIHLFIAVLHSLLNDVGVPL